jgi:eukaryotic-like serine/threonine-protein kinase
MVPGSLIGKKYRLTRAIGEGSMGVVWAAVNQDTLGEVALKLIVRSNDEIRQRLRREARAAGKLRHPNIIEIYDIGETVEGDPFLVMPLLTGQTLSELLEQKRRLSPELAARIARDVARALAAAHAGQVIHRDLKPANIFLHQEPHAEAPIVKVLDFGVSKNLASTDGMLTMAGGAVGTPAYMSPEQARADRTLDHRSDLWSLGVVLFEMLTGVRPFKGDAHQILPQIVIGEIPPVSRFDRHIDPDLCDLVARCLERNRDKRVRSAADLAAELERFVSPAPAAPPAPRASVASAPGALDLANLEATALMPVPRAPASGPGVAPAAPRAPFSSRPEAVVPAAPRAPFSSRPEAVSPSSRSPQLETLSPSVLQEEDAESFVQTTRMSADKMVAMMRPRPPAPSAPRIEASPPAQPIYATTTPIGPFGQGLVPPAPRFGSAPALTPSLQDTERLGPPAPGPWQPRPSHPSSPPSGGAVVESGNWPVAKAGPRMPPLPNAANQSPVPRPGSPSALGSSTAPLFRAPMVDPAVSSETALLVDLRSRRRMTLLIAASVGIAALIVLGLVLYYSL